MSAFCAMVIGGLIGSVFGAFIGVLAASLCSAAGRADRDAGLEQSRRDDTDELGQIFDKRI